MVATALTDSPPTGTVVFSSSSCAARWVACSVPHADSSRSRGQLNRSPRYRIAGLAVRRSAGAASPAMNVVDGTDPGEPRCRYGDPRGGGARGSPCWRSGRCTPTATPSSPHAPRARTSGRARPRWDRSTVGSGSPRRTARSTACCSPASTLQRARWSSMAISEPAASYYEHHGFRPLSDDLRAPMAHVDEIRDSLTSDPGAAR